MDIPEHKKEHAAMNLNFRFPAEGNTYFKFTTTKIELYVNGVKKQEWT